MERSRSLYLLIVPVLVAVEQNQDSSPIIRNYNTAGKLCTFNGKRVSTNTGTISHSADI